MSFAKFFELTLRQPTESQKGGDGAGKNVRKLYGGSVRHFNMFFCHGLKRLWMAEVDRNAAQPHLSSISANFVCPALFIVDARSLKIRDVCTRSHGALQAPPF